MSKGQQLSVRILISIISLVMMGLLMVSAGVGAEETKPAEPIIITVDKALQLALDNNVSLAIARLELAYAQKQLTKAQADNALSASPVAIRQAEVAVETAQLSLKQTERQVRLDAQNAYYTAVNAIQQLAVAEKSLEQAKEQLRIIQAKFNEGLATKLDVFNAEKGVLQAENALEEARNSQELALLELKKVLGLSYTTEIKVEQPEAVVEPVKLTEAEVVEKVLANSLQLTRLQRALEIAQMQEENANNDYTAPLLKEIYANRRMKAELDLKEGTRAVYLQAKQAWNALQQAENGVELVQKELEMAQESYRITKVRFEGGLEIPNNLLRAQINLTQAESKAVKAVFDYNLAKTRLLNLVGE